MVKSPISQLERFIGRPFKNKKFVLTALTHPSYPSPDSQQEASQNFQRLEFLGDSILNLYIATKLYGLYPKASEGLLSRLRSILVSRKLLARIAGSIRLRNAMHMGDYERNPRHTAHNKIMADAFEALIAAIYFDRGLKAAHLFLERCFEPHLDQKKLFRFDPNPKSSLQEYVQKKYGRLPAYRSKHHEDGTFTAWVSVKRSETKGEGRTKQEAEAKAARAMLRKLRSKV